MTRNSKKKATSTLKEKNLPGSVKSDIRKDFGLNRSRDVPNHLQNKANLALVIENFFQRSDVVRICPSQESNQIHYRLGHLKTLDKKFISETELECAYSTFTRNIMLLCEKTWSHRLGDLSLYDMCESRNEIRKTLPL